MATTKTTKVTPAQAEAFAEAVRDIAQARAVDFETWFMYGHYTNTYGEKYESFEDAVEKHYRFFARRDHKSNQEAYIKECVNRAREQYEKFRSGIGHCSASSHTIRALEKKGLIEIINDGRRSYDTIRLLYI